MRSNAKVASAVFDVLCPAGRVVFIGMPTGPIPYDVVAAQVKEATVEHVFRYAHVFPRALALMSSGLNGQQFRFNGYLPVDNAGRTKTLKDLEAESQRLHCTQIFIETPYRNDQLLTSILAVCRPITRLCIAANLTGPAEYIRTLPISAWRQLEPQTETAPQKDLQRASRGGRPLLHKQPTIFLLLA